MSLSRLMEDAIIKCQTHSYKAKELAKGLRSLGFDGKEVAELVKELETALKFVHLYQAYNNAENVVVASGELNE